MFVWMRGQAIGFAWRDIKSAKVEQVSWMA
jgi:hypothetical protein